MQLGMRIYLERHLLASLPGIIQRGRPPFSDNVMHASRDGGQTCDGTRVKLS